MKRKRENDEITHTVLKKFKLCRKRNMDNDLNEVFKKVKLSENPDSERDKMISYNQQQRDILLYI